MGIKFMLSFFSYIESMSQSSDFENFKSKLDLDKGKIFKLLIKLI